MTHPKSIEPERGPEAAVDDVDDALLVHGVHEGFPEHRRPLAVQLANNGWMPEDITLLARSIRGAADPTAALVGVLRDRVKAEARLVDLRRAEQLRKKPYPGEKDWKRVDEAAEPGYEISRRRRMAHALIYGDRKSPEFAAREIGCDPEQAQRWADEQHGIGL